MPADRNPDVIVAAFLAAIEHDRTAGVERELSDYLARFPGYEVELAAAWHDLAAGGERAVEASFELVPGDRFAGYEILAVVGRGGQGIVYEAFEPELRRVVALKVLHRSQLWSSAAHARFAREVHLTARLAHPGISPVFARGFENGVPWIAMRLLTGETLAARLSRARDAGEVLPWQKAVEWLSAAADAVAHAQAAGVVHRDLKPGNLWLDEDGRVLVLDFGLAVEFGDDGLASDLTRSGEQFGTPGYMAPEQLGVFGSGAGRTSTATDVFALGIVLYEAVAGRRPFPSTSLGAYERAVEAGPPDVRRERGGLPRDLAALLRVALAVRPTERYVDAAALRADLERLLADLPILASAPGRLRRLWRWAGRERALAAALGAAFAMLVTGLVIVSLALADSERSASQSAVTAAGALVRLEQYAPAREQLARCGEAHRGFAYGLLARELDNGLLGGGALPAAETAVEAEADGSRVTVRFDGRELALPSPGNDRWLLVPSPDRTVLAFVTSPPGSGAAEIAFVDGVTGARRAGCSLPGAQVTAVAFTPDSTWFWTASQLARAPGRALLQSWSVATGELLIERAVEGPVVRALLPIAERQVAIGRADGVVQLVPWSEDRGPVALVGHRSAIARLAATDDGFASVDELGEARHWDLAMRGAGRWLDTGGEAVVALRWRDGGEVVEAWSRLRPLVSWCPHDFTLRAFAGDAEPPAPNGTTVRHPLEPLEAAGSAAGTVQLAGDANVSLRTGIAPVTALAFSPDGHQLAVGHADGVVTVLAAARFEPGRARETAAVDAALGRLAELGHEARLMCELSPSEVDGGWARLAESRLCWRAVGRPWAEFHELCAMPFVPAGVHRFALENLARLRRTGLGGGLLSPSEFLALLRCGRLDDAVKLLSGESGRYVSPELRGLLAALRGESAAGERPVVGGATSRIAREIRDRGDEVGRAAYAWLERALADGVAWPEVPARVAASGLPGPVAAKVVELWRFDPAQQNVVTERCFRFLIWAEPPAALRDALRDWSAQLVLDSTAERPRIAHAAALLRCGEPAEAATRLAPIVERGPWREADPEAVAFYALACHGTGDRAAAARWRDRLRVLHALPANRARQGLTLLLRELEHGLR
ncbi:MAG: protein kinase [Planctomycetes bacterium]|nr:protein kinase [Planctomycetota bacterium]